MRAGELEWHDKMDLKHGYDMNWAYGSCRTPARYGAYISPGAILMPLLRQYRSLAGAGTMVDTWATVGSCAQVGERVHLSGGVGVGGVLEPVQAAPVIIEDDCFIGSRAIVVEGAHTSAANSGVGRRRSDYRIDAHYRRNGGGTQTAWRGYVSPPDRWSSRAAIPSVSPPGEVRRPRALIIGRRKESTDKKTSLTANPLRVSEFRYNTFGCTGPAIIFSKRRPRPTTRPWNPRYGHGDAICAERQSAGRGQRGHTWSAEE